MTYDKWGEPVQILVPGKPDKATQEITRAVELIDSLMGRAAMCDVCGEWRHERGLTKRCRDQHNTKGK
jgi:hypothetical protein